MTHDQFNWTFGTIAAVAASLTVLMGLLGPQSIKRYGKVLVGAWVVLPAIFFWADWVIYCHGLSKERIDEITHTHDLSRNVWVALVSVLVVLFEIKPFGALSKD